MHKLFQSICRMLNAVLIKRHNVNVGDGYQLNGILKISNSGTIIFGNDLKINSGWYFNPVGGSKRTVFVTQKNATIRIGNHCGISNSLIYAAHNVTIEDYVMIGGGCTICDTDFHPLDYEKRVIHDVDSIVNKPVCIKEGAFIGMNSIILKGVTIGKHSIVGAGSVVTKNIPDGEIWGGNPARFIKAVEQE